MGIRSIGLPTYYISYVTIGWGEKENGNCISKSFRKIPLTTSKSPEWR